MKGGLGYLGIAYVVIWTAIGCYLLLLGRRQHTIDKRLAQVQAELQSAQRDNGSG
jgi:CcmD family protein